MVIWSNYDYAWIDYVCYYQSPFLCDAFPLTIPNDYIVVQEYKDFTDAELYCQQNYGTHLATIVTQSDLESAKTLCNETYWDCWIGFDNPFQTINKTWC